MTLAHIHGAATKWPHATSANARRTSDYSESYNCIAFAAGDTTQEWWPETPVGAYWPPTALNEVSIRGFVSAFQTLGYIQCPGGDFEDGYEKVALYVDEMGEPTHMALQVDADWWASKLGWEIDIHHTLKALEGPHYGTVSLFMRRSKQKQ